MHEITFFPKKNCIFGSVQSWTLRCLFFYFRLSPPCKIMVLRKLNFHKKYGSSGIWLRKMTIKSTRKYWFTRLVWRWSETRSFRWSCESAKKGKEKGRWTEIRATKLYVLSYLQKWQIADINSPVRRVFRRICHARLKIYLLYPNSCLYDQFKLL